MAWSRGWEALRLIAFPEPGPPAQRPSPAHAGQRQQANSGMDGILAPRGERELMPIWASPAQRAAMLLCKNLTPEQLDQYRTRRYFEVTGGESGKRYRLWHCRHQNVEELDAGGNRVALWCFQPASGPPLGDVLLAQKTALELFETAAIGIANRYSDFAAGCGPGSTGDSSEEQLRDLLNARMSARPLQDSLAQSLSLDAVAPEVAIGFLTASFSGEAEAAAAKVAKVAGYSPLALLLAASYCRAANLGFDTLCERLAEAAKKWPSQAQVQRPVYASFHLAMEWAIANYPQAGRIMGLFAFLAPDRIPLDMIAPGHVNAMELAEGLAALRELSLLRLDVLDNGRPSVSLNRFVQPAMQCRLIEQQKHTYFIGEAIRLLTRCLPAHLNAGEVQQWPTWKRIEPHALAALGHAAAQGATKTGEMALLLKHAASHFSARADYARAEDCFRRAIAAAEETLNPNHLDLGFILNDYSVLLCALRRFEEAEPFIRRALAIEEAVSGDSHASVGIRLNNLAQVLHELHRYHEAEPLYRRSIAIGEATEGPDSSRMSGRLNNLAMLCSSLGRKQEAEKLCRRALAIAEKALGPNHPDVANRLVNLSYLLRQDQRFCEAEAPIRRAIAIEEAAFGADHPNIADDLRNLGELLVATGRAREAEAAMARAVSICERRLPEQHPWREWTRNGLARARAAMRAGS